MKIDDAFAAGTLVHPMVGAPSSLDLFRATANLAGGPRFESTDNTRRVEEAIGHHDHYLFVLVDGLGMCFRDAWPSGGFFETSFHSQLNSVFPSTTAVALTSLATCRWPADHGLTGWFTYFPEHQRVFAPLLFRERGTDLTGEELGFSLPDLVNGSPLLGSFFRNVASVLPDSIKDGSYATWSRGGTEILPFRRFGRARRIVRRRLRRPEGPTYTYLYLTSVDHLAHEHGAASDEVRREIARVDRLLTKIRESLPTSVRMITTADHGLVDITPETHFVFRDQDELARTLYAGQTGEGSAPVFHVRDEEAFLAAFAAHPASAYFELYRPADLAERGLYGPVDLSPQMTAHLGDYVGIATEPALLEYVAPGRDPVPHIGVHGGLRPGEIEVPLFLA